MNELRPIFDTRKSFYGKAIVVDNADGFYLYSYGTKVFFIPIDNGGDDNDSNGMRLLWKGYSNTTYRHIREFIEQYASYSQKEGLSNIITKKEIKSFYKGEQNK